MVHHNSLEVNLKFLGFELMLNRGAKSFVLNTCIVNKIFAPDGMYYHHGNVYMGL